MTNYTAFTNSSPIIAHYLRRRTNSSCIYFIIFNFTAVSNSRAVFT